MGTSSPASAFTAVGLGAALSFLGWAEAARAHQVGLSRGVYVVTDGTVDVELTFARPEVLALVPALDANADRAIDERELAAAEADFGARVVPRIAFHAGGAPCPGTFAGASLIEEDGLALRASFACPHADRFTADLLLLKGLSSGHRHLARVVTQEGASDHLASSDVPTFSFGGHATPPSRAAFIGIGVEHILLGFDHLVFLFGLLLVGGRLRSLLAVITAFTLAHSVTLALAVLDVVAPPPALVEPLIALSIAYVGVENFLVKSAAGRWRITALFGLIHGFGFAGALGEVGVPRDDVPMTLLLFNVGVELGQLLVMALVVPVLLTLRARGLLGSRATRGLSAGIVLLGMFWMVERVAGALKGG